MGSRLTEYLTKELPIRGSKIFRRWNFDKLKEDRAQWATVSRPISIYVIEQRRSGVLTIGSRYDVVKLIRELNDASPLLLVKIDVPAFRNYSVRPVVKRLNARLKELSVPGAASKQNRRTQIIKMALDEALRRRLFVRLADECLNEHTEYYSPELAEFYENNKYLTRTKYHRSSSKKKQKKTKQQ